MEGCCIKFALALLFFLGAIFCINCDAKNYESEAAASCHDHEREALTKFRSGLVYGSYHQVASWNRSTRDCCKWRGVECDHQTGYVLELDLFPSFLHDYYFVMHGNSGNQTDRRLSGQLDPVLLELEQLQFLDLSGNSFNGIPVPEFLGSFQNLRYLNLSYSGFAGQIPQQLGNLSNMEQLDIRDHLSTNTLQWLKGMPILKSLRLDSVNLSEVGNDWVQVLMNNSLPFLYELDLSDCELREITTTISSTNLNSLRKLNLGGNDFESKIPSWIANISSLESMDLGYNKFHGAIPHGLSELPHLIHLNLGGNHNLTGNSTQLLQGVWRSIKLLNFGGNKLYGPLPSSIGNLTCLEMLELTNCGIEGLPETITNPCSFVNNGSYCHETTPLPNLRVLNLKDNKISRNIPNWLGKLKSLEELDMRNCYLTGPIPTNFGDLSSLRILSLENNRLSGTIPIDTWNIPRLEQLFLGDNLLMGSIGDAQLNQLQKLVFMDFSSNSFVFNLPNDWVPVFQLEFLNLEACSIGPSFPQWLITQKSLRALIISNNSIDESLPPWFWDFAGPLEWLDLSRNKIKGLLPKTWNYSSHYINFDISENQFSGLLPQTYLTPLPQFFSISGNQITGTIPNSICDVVQELYVLDLSQNNIVGNISTGLGNCSLLQGLDLSKNYLTGEIPWSLSKLSMLLSLRLGKNELSGMIPLSLGNCSNLKILDLGENNLVGNISPVVQNANMRILKLHSNKFTGPLPSNMPSMGHLEILDLSNNMLSGLIPKSIGEFATLSRRMVSKDRWDILYLNFGFYTTEICPFEKLWMSFKGEEIQYDRTLYLVVGIDLSRNDFYGKIPKELMRLNGLIFLNLSHNHFTGAIPENIGELRWLESLDISSNQLEGEIPPSLLQLTFLEKLNLSHNHLQGRIPFGGQLQILGDQSVYEGNIELCGLPLERRCAAIDAIPTIQNSESEKRNDERWFFMGMIFGFMFGFCAFCGILIFNQSFRIAFYELFDVIMDKSFLLIVMCLAKVNTRV